MAGLLTRKPRGLDSDRVKTLLKYMAKVNVWTFERSGGRILGTFPGGNGRVPVLVLRHVGRKTGQPRKTPLVYLEDGDRTVVVASQAGRPHDPAWYLNLVATPEAEILTRAGRRRVRARTATAEERAALWPRLVELYPDYDNYQSWCPREIPVVVLDHR